MVSTDGRVRRREYWHLPARATRVLLATPDAHLLAEVARTAQETLPKATILMYEDASHALNGEYPDRIATDAGRFLSTLE